MCAALHAREMIVASSFVLAIIAPSAWLSAQHDPPDVSPNLSPRLPVTADGNSFVRPPHLVVVRISEDVLGGQLDRTIDITTPVNDIVLGTPVSGVARVVGQPRVELSPSADQARFNVVVSGTVYSRTVCQHGPATIHGHSITHFTATKEVFYEPGKGFHSLPPKVVASSQCYTDGISTSRGGLVGRIVQRRASEEIASRQPQLTAIARDRATRRIKTAFERQLTDRIAQLNRAVDFQVQLAGLRNREDRRRLIARTTPQYLEIADMIDQGSRDIKLPTRPTTSTCTPSIEIWVRASLVPEKLADALPTIFTNPDQSAMLNALALLPGTLGKDAAAVITALASENKLGVQNLGDWLVIDVNTTPKSTIASRTAPEPAAQTRR